MKTVQVTLKKYDNQAGQYKQFQQLELDDDQFSRGLEVAIRRNEVKGFYLYEWEYGGSTRTYYSVSPSIFDQPQIHMT